MEPETWHPMDGTCIREAGYDPFTRHLWIRFVDGDGTPYRFKGFPRSKWNDFKAASSKGGYYHAFIRGRYYDSEAAKSA